MDNNRYVVKWGYECHTIPYFNPIKNAQTIYYPDIFAHVVNTKGEHSNFLIEIKPAQFRVPPQYPRKATKASLTRYAKAKIAYQINVAKWQAAEAWCRRHNVKWLILSEAECKWFVNKYN